jgi:hypothetical protein
VLLEWIRARAAGAPPQIRPLALGLAVFALVAGVFALLWGCAALRRLAGAHPGTAAELAGAGGAVALGLYGLAPLGQALGLQVNHWTFLGLVGLALVAYALEEAYVRLSARVWGPRRR